MAVKTLQYCKTLRPEAATVMGGPHVTYLTEEALEHADFVFRGEGEAALAAFIDAREKGSGYADVPNLSYRDATGAAVHNPMAPRAADLDRPPPDRIRERIREKDPVLVATRKTLSGKAVEDHPPTSYEMFVLGGLQHKQVYQGTVRPNVKRLRRARGKVAKLSRRINRGS